MTNKPVFWKQRNGELISVDKMNINHLRNVLKMIIKNNQKVQRVIVNIGFKFKLNGDMANQFNDDMEYGEFNM